MNDTDRPTSEVVCPCCGARLKIDLQLGKVLAHEPPNRPARPSDLDRAAFLLERRAQEREARFRQSAEDEKSKALVLERKFAEALEKAKDQPVTPPARDIDLD